MATILFAAAGAAIGSGFGGTVLGLSGAVIGKAVGATLGRAIDQRIMGGGSEPVEVGKIDRFQVMGASEGTAIPKVWGRMRIPGQVIWSSPFQQITNTTRSSGGKGRPSQTTVQYSYTVSLAVALCEGEILGVGRIWADGVETSPQSLNMRVYTGSESQLPDPTVETHVGSLNAPAYRGIAYVVLENLDLSIFGNRVPQLSFEVMRRAQGKSAEQVPDLQDAIRAVAIIPGTGEYALSTTKVWEDKGLGNTRSYNVNSPSRETDLETSLKQLRRELPNCHAASLVVSWFGSDLRCGYCEIKPKVESTQSVGASLPWRAGGIDRFQASEVPKLDGRSLYGGTPADQSVLEAIAALKAHGKSVMFYPFILMEQLQGNALPNPYTDANEQPVMPWRGRITLSSAPGRPNSPDATDAARTEVRTFFGSTKISDFQIVANTVIFTGEDVWCYRRFILHYAHLCKIGGGVESFCIGSEMRALTQIRASNHRFPAVEELISLAADVREILGPTVKLSYAADWSEYFGYHVEGNVYFHLDPLWSDTNIDFVGIDNYMPLSDWRDGDDHVDASWQSNYNLDYLMANIAGGEGFDWYYESSEGAVDQLRSPIVGFEHQEDWIYRYKDVRSWWQHEHFNRINGLRLEMPTGWIPESKPVRFTEYGCAAVDKGTNEPNKFYDGRSSESALPRASLGSRDDFVQMQYYRAQYIYWANASNNPHSRLYSGRMIDWNYCYAWSWDARPHPEFPRNDQVWSDGPSYYRGHWLNGRAASAPLDRVIREVCEDCGLVEIDSSFAFGTVHGYVSATVQSGRSILQPLLACFGFDTYENEGKLHFKSRDLVKLPEVIVSSIVERNGKDYISSITRADASENITSLRFSYIMADGSFALSMVEALDPSSETTSVVDAEYQLLFPSEAAKNIVLRWQAEAYLSKEKLTLSLPMSYSDVEVGSLISNDFGTFRVDRLQIEDKILCEASRCDQLGQRKALTEDDKHIWKAFEVAGRLFHLWLDLPQFDALADDVSPYLAVTGKPWTGPAVLWSSSEDSSYSLNTLINRPAMIGLTQSALLGCRPGIIDRGEELLVQFRAGALESTSQLSLLSGRNLVAIGDGSKDRWEIFQFMNAELRGPGLYGLSLRLRGQMGTDAFIRERWEPGSFIVVLDEAITRIQLPKRLLNVEQHFRIGPAKEPIGSESVVHDIASFSGASLRPFSVCHLAGERSPQFSHVFRWIRRTRLDGDGWSVADVPLNEETEQYLITITDTSGQLKLTRLLSEPFFELTQDSRVALGITGIYCLSVSQVSSWYGPGPARTIEFSD